MSQNATENVVKVSRNCWQVTGPPGTGKTTRLAALATTAIEKHGANRVLIASLTKAAAHEFSSRGLSAIPRDQIGTLHSLCFRALGRPQLAETEAHIDDWNEYAAKHSSALYQLTARSASGNTGFDMSGNTESLDGDVFLAQLNVLRSRYLGDIQWNDRNSLHLYGVSAQVASFRLAWNAWKAEAKVLDFVDLLEQCLLHVDRAPGDPRAMFGDEAQDWSRLETTLFRDRWGIHADEVYLIGDPAQCIYDWRGADPRIFLDHPVPEEQKILLEQSYRVPKAVHKTATHWLSAQDPDRAGAAYKPRDSDGFSGMIGNNLDPYGTPRLADWLGRRLEKSGDETIMVLATCSYMLGPLIGALRERGIPFANPYRIENYQWNPLRRGSEGGAGRRKATTALDRTLAFLKPSSALYGDHAGEWSWDDLWKWLDPLPARGADAVLSYGTKKRLAERAQAVGGRMPGKFTMEEFGALFVGGWEGPYADAAHKGDIAWWIAAMPKAMRARFTLHQKIIEKRGPRALLEKPRIIIGTCHSVKGGEATTVIVSPELSMAAWRAAYIHGGSGLARQAVGRLFYVAMTRAKENLLVMPTASPRSVNLAGYTDRASPPP